MPMLLGGSPTESSSPSARKQRLCPEAPYEQLGTAAGAEVEADVEQGRRSEASHAGSSPASVAHHSPQPRQNRSTWSLSHHSSAGPPPPPPTEARSATASGQVQYRFRWNGHDCLGRPIHQAALLGQYDDVADILQDTPSEVHMAFTFNYYHEGQPTSGTGYAQHLAASKGHLETLKVLLAHDAPLHCYVTRGGEPHYDLLHAAVFAEGFPDKNTMKVVRYLLEDKDFNIAQDIDGYWPLHLAFSTGSLELVRLLRQAAHAQGKVDEVESAESQELPSPLQLGIESGRMTERKLAKAAAHTPLSLRTFIDHEPRCVPHFIHTIKEQGLVSAASLAAHLTGRDLATVVHVSPLAALALLHGVLETPVCEGHGWHSLPSRVSFAPQGWVEYLRYVVNPGREILAFYEPEATWKFDVARFEAPAWHAQLNVVRGKPIYDCEIKVCHVPNIICAEFFAALGGAATDDYDEVLAHPVVTGSIEYAWWQGACKVDILQVVLSLWGLVVLILESWLLHESEHDHGTARARQLRPLGNGDIDWGGDGSSTPAAIMLEVSVAADFIGAKGVVDFWHELLQFFGCLAIGRGMDYVNFGNAWDLLRAAILMTLFFDRTSQTLRVFVIFICWMRLLDIFTSAEKIAAALLPIKRSAKGLMPVLIVTLVSFCAFMHAFYYVWANNNVDEVIYRSFSTLITAELPSRPQEKSLLEVLLTYGAVIFFSIFILNIFIGVIGQQYEQEQERVQVTLKHERAQCCLNFLLRARVLPCGLCSQHMAFALSSLAALGLLWLQLSGFDKELHWGVFSVHGGHSPTMLRRSLFALLQMGMIVLQYQNYEAPWAADIGGAAVGGNSDSRRYLWIALPVPEEDDPQGKVELDRVLSKKASRRATCRDNWGP